jgi:hypothetical protein
LIGEHVLLPCAGSIVEAHARLEPRITAETLDEVIALVPSDWLQTDRETYAEYLLTRAQESQFAQEAEDARAGT